MTLDITLTLTELCHTGRERERERGREREREGGREREREKEGERKRKREKLTTAILLMALETKHTNMQSIINLIMISLSLNAHTSDTNKYI